MSVHVLSWVLRHSEETLGRRLVLIVLADHAKEDGSSSWPSVNTIAREARMTRRPVQTALRQLEEHGAIIPVGTSKAGTTIYTIAMGGAESAQGGAEATQGGALQAAQGGAATAPKPSLKQPSKDLAPGKPAQERDEIWDELEKLFGKVADKTTAHAKRNKAVADLKRAGATPETVAAAARAWPRMFEATLTDTALATHFPQLVHRRAGPEALPATEILNLPEISEEERLENLQRLGELGSSVGRSAA